MKTPPHISAELPPPVVAGRPAGDLAGVLLALGQALPAAEADVVAFTATIRQTTATLRALLDDGMVGELDAGMRAELYTVAGELLDRAADVAAILPLVDGVIAPALIAEARMALADHTPIVRAIVARLTWRNRRGGSEA
jgi:hypothetical protein